MKTKTAFGEPGFGWVSSETLASRVEKTVAKMRADDLAAEVLWTRQVGEVGQELGIGAPVHVQVGVAPGVPAVPVARAIDEDGEALHEGLFGPVGPEEAVETVSAWVRRNRARLRRDLGERGSQP